MSWVILGSCGAILRTLRAQERPKRVQETPRRAPRTPKKTPREPKRLPEALGSPWGSLGALLGLSWAVSMPRKPQFYWGKTKDRENKGFWLRNIMWSKLSKNHGVPLQKCTPLSHESSKMYRPNLFFHFEDILDVKKTETVPSKTLVLLLQNEGLWQIIKIWLKMTSRNNKKRRVKTATNKSVVFLLFCCRTLHKSSSRVGAVTISENYLKK